MRSESINPKEIVSIKNKQTLVSFEENLKAAPCSEYAKIHANKSVVEGYEHKRTSLIKIIMQDYSKGTGEKNVIVFFQITPSQARYIYSRVYVGHREFEFSKMKIYGSDLPQQATVQKISIKRKPLAKDGKPMKYPWSIEIENGVGTKITGKDGNIFCEDGSYVCQKKVSKLLNDEEMFECFDKVNTVLNMFELTYGRQAYVDGKKYLHNIAGIDKAVNE